MNTNTNSTNEEHTPDSDPAWDDTAPGLTMAGRTALEFSDELRRIDPENERLAALNPLAFVP